MDCNVAGGWAQPRIEACREARKPALPGAGRSKEQVGTVTTAQTTPAPPPPPRFKVNLPRDDSNASLFFHNGVDANQTETRIS